MSMLIKAFIIGNLKLAWLWKESVEIIMETNRENELGKPLCQNESEPAGDKIHNLWSCEHHAGD